MDLTELFDADDIAAVRGCFGPTLPSPVVERVLEMRIERRESVIDDGQRYIEFYKDNKLHGHWQTWFPSGRKLAECYYHNGKRHGKFVEWFENGRKNVEVHFRYGLLHGTWEVWCETGQKLSEECYQNDKLHGRSVFHNSITGEQAFEQIYEDGKLVETIWPRKSTRMNK